MPGPFLSICRALLTQIDYQFDMTDAIFLPLTRAWGGEGYDEDRDSRILFFRWNIAKRVQRSGTSEAK